ncbi:MAG: hypothetical protein R3Y65_02265 [Bacillota bacterium]
MKNQTTKQTQNQTTEQTQTTTATLAVQYDIDMTFAEQVDAVESNDYKETHLKVSDHTPVEIQKVGYNDLPILITATKVKTAIGIEVRGKNTHNISKETLKNTPTLLQNPIDILQSKTRADSVVVVLDAVDNVGSQIICSMVKDGVGNYNNLEISSNVITSIYGKENSKGLLETSKKAEKKELDITETPSLQLANNLNNSTSTDNIRQSAQNVNSNTQNNSKNNTKYDLADDFRELTDADVSNMGTNYHSKISQFYELNGIKKEDAKLAQSNDLKFANTDIKTVFMNVILM